jgi:hypothetical protein
MAEEEELESCSSPAFNAFLQHYLRGGHIYAGQQVLVLGLAIAAALRDEDLHAAR